MKHTEKGMWKRTFGIFKNIRIPWILYFLQVILGIISTKTALLYVPYEADLKLGNLSDIHVVLGYAGLLLLAVVIKAAESIPAFYAEGQLTRNLRNKLIGHSLRLPVRTLEQTGSKIASWITEDCTYANGLITSIIGFITGIAATYMSMTSMSSIDQSMLFIVPVILVYILFSTWLEGRIMFLRERRGRDASALLTSYLSEHLGYYHQIRQMNTMEQELERGKKAFEEYYKAEIYMAVISLINILVSGSLTQIISILIFIVGVPKVNSGAITLSQLAEFQSYILIAYQSLSSLPGIYTNLMYYNGILFFIGNNMAEKEEVSQREYTMDMPDEDIIFDDVSFSYSNKEVLHHASFTIPKGKRTVIVGPNGSGKTTVFKLIERFYQPTEGRVMFGKLDAERIHLDEWRQSIAYVLQESQLFDRSVRDNISYGLDRSVSDSEVESAAKLACADEFIREFPEGYDYAVGENGIRLSAGQKQRIAIARAMMMDPSYLLLDEATCNVDAGSERRVLDGLKKVMEGRTTVMISHDMNSLKDADHIIVLNNGTVEAEGTYEETIRRSEMLRKLVAASGTGGNQ